jgi:predicted RNase H-like nuclease (RuvC/YqgF family)
MKGVWSMSEEHERLIPLHDELLKRNAEDIKELKQEIYGIPQRIDNLEKSVMELCKTVADSNKMSQELIRGFENKYQTKELFDMTCRDVEKEIADLKKEVEDLKKEKDAIKNKLIATFGLFIVQLLVWIFLNHDKIVGR